MLTSTSTPALVGTSTHTNKLARTYNFVSMRVHRGAPMDVQRDGACMQTLVHSCSMADIVQEGARACLA